MNRYIGILLVIVSAAGYGTLAIFSRYAYAQGMDVTSILFLRFILSGILMSFLLVSRREALPHGQVLYRLIIMGAICYVGQAFSFVTAVKYASAGLVALLLYLYPSFVAVLSALFLKEKITLPKALALCLALAGTAFTVGPLSGQWLGILLAIVSAVIYSIYILLGSEVIKRVSAFQSSTVIFASSTLVTGFITIVHGLHLPTNGAGWTAIVGMVLLATILPALTFLAGMQRIGPTNAAMFSTLEPAVTVLLAVCLFRETVSLTTVLGGSLILSAVILLTVNELRRPAALPLSPSSQSKYLS